MPNMVCYFFHSTMAQRGCVPYLSFVCLRGPCLNWFRGRNPFAGFVTPRTHTLTQTKHSSDAHFLHVLQLFFFFPTWCHPTSCGEGAEGGGVRRQAEAHGATTWCKNTSCTGKMTPASLSVREGPWGRIESKTPQQHAQDGATCRGTEQLL